MYSEKIFPRWCLLLGPRSCEHLRGTYEAFSGEEFVLIDVIQKVCSCKHLRENLFFLMSSEKMCWARRQFPARLASLLLLLVVLGLNLLLWQVDNFHQCYGGFIQSATTLWNQFCGGRVMFVLHLKCLGKGAEKSVKSMVFYQTPLGHRFGLFYEKIKFWNFFVSTYSKSTSLSC